MTDANKTSKSMQITVWVLQIILAAMFLMAGFMKLTQPIEKLSQMLPWTSQVPLGLVRFIGFSEFLGAVGLLLPSILRILPGLTAWSAIGIATIMVLAIGYHVCKGEMRSVLITLVIGAMAVFVACVRLKARQN